MMMIVAEEINMTGETEVNQGRKAEDTKEQIATKKRLLGFPKMKKVQTIEEDIILWQDWVPKRRTKILQPRRRSRKNS